MKLGAMILLMIALLSQNTAAGAKKKRGGSRLGKLFINILQLLSLHQQSEQLRQPRVYHQCPMESEPFTFPPNVIGVMKIIHCAYKHEEFGQTHEFMDKYLLDVELQTYHLYGANSCRPIYYLWDKVKDEACKPIMWYKGISKIVSGAMRRVFGRGIGRDENNEMFREAVWNLDAPRSEDAKLEELVEQFENLENLDFFRIWRAYEFFLENENMTFVNALKEAMKQKYQGMDFDQVHRALKYTEYLKKFSLWHLFGYTNQAQMAKEAQFQILNFDNLDFVRAKLYKSSLLNRKSVEMLTRPENQDMDWRKVVQMIPFAMKRHQAWFMDVIHDRDYIGDRIDMIFDRKYQQLDMVLADFVYRRLEELDSSNTHEVVELALENWLQYFSNGLDVKKIKQICVTCKETPEPLSCFRSKTLQFKETESIGENASNDEGEEIGFINVILDEIVPRRQDDGDKVNDDL